MAQTKGHAIRVFKSANGHPLKQDLPSLKVFQFCHFWAAISSASFRPVPLCCPAIRQKLSAPHSVAHGDGFVQIMGNEKHRFSFCSPQGEHFVLHQLTRLNVQRTEWLAHQNDVRVESQYLGECTALAHAARKLMRIAVTETAKPNPF